MSARLLSRLGPAALLACTGMAASMVAPPGAAAAPTCLPLMAGTSLCVEIRPGPSSAVTAYIRNDKTGNVATVLIGQATTTTTGSNTVVAEVSNNAIVSVKQARDGDVSGTSLLVVSPGGVLTVVQAAGPGYCEVFVGGVPFPSETAPCPDGFVIPILPHLLP